MKALVKMEMDGFGMFGVMGSRLIGFTDGLDIDEGKGGIRDDT